MGTWSSSTTDAGLSVLLASIALSTVGAVSCSVANAGYDRSTIMSRESGGDLMGNDQEISSAVLENQQTLDLLATQIRRGSVIPYVGAGLSIPFGFDGWTHFLISASPPEIRAKTDNYIKTEKFEEAAEQLQEYLGHLAFEDTLEQKFGPRKLDGKFDGFAEAELDKILPAVLYVP